MIALLFLTVMGLIVASLLSFGDSSFRASISANDLRAKDLSAQSAVDANINLIRGDLSKGIEGDSSCGASATNLDGFGNVTVSCSPQSGSGSGSSRLPKNAILTLSTNPAEGIVLDKNNTLYIRGAVYSHSAILLNGAAKSTLRVVGNIVSEASYASGEDCDDSNVQIAPGSLGTKRCGQSSPNGADPNYQAATTLSAMPLAVPPPTCEDRGGYKLAVFEPGPYVISPTTLAALACGSNVDGQLFKPGNFYFNNVAWDTSGQDVVAGTPNPAWYSSSTGNPPSGADGGCANGSPGTQFILGGTSAINISNATRRGGTATTFNICAPVSASGPSIAIFAAKDGTQGFNSQSGNTQAQPFSGGSTTATLFAGNKPNVYVHGSVYAPLAALDLDLHNSAEEFFDRGVIARTLLFHISASSTQLGSPIFLPACSSTPGDCRRDRVVVLTASIGGKPVLRSLVNLTDADGAVPGATVSTPAWSVLR